MNVEDNILLPYYIKERTVNEKTCQLMNEYLTIMNLAGINKRDIHSLSGGEQQRVAIVLNLVTLLCCYCIGCTERLIEKHVFLYVERFRKR